MSGPPAHENPDDKGRDLSSPHPEGVKKSTDPVIPCEAMNLHLSISDELNQMLRCAQSL